MPAVSVLIPFYNHHDFIESCLESLVDPDFLDFEVCIFDDGSSRPLELDATFLASFPAPIHIVRSAQNLGVGKARNQLLTMASGQFYAWQDADDRSIAGRLSKQFRYLAAQPDCMAVGSAIYFSDESGEKLLRSEAYLSPASRWDGFSGCCASFMIRADAYARFGAYDDAMTIASEDVDFLLRIQPPEAVHNLDEKLYIYRQHAGQTTKGAEWLQSHTLFFLDHLLTQLHAEGKAVLSNPSLSAQAKISWFESQPLLNLDVHEAGRLTFEHARLNPPAGQSRLRYFSRLVRRFPRSAASFSRKWLIVALKHIVDRAGKRISGLFKS